MNDDVVAPLERLIETAPLRAAAVGFAFLLPFADLSQPAVEQDLHVQGVRKLCEEALEGGQLRSVDNDEFHGWVAPAVRLPCHADRAEIRTSAAWGYRIVTQDC
jgi:hypothetical protein